MQVHSFFPFTIFVVYLSIYFLFVCCFVVPVLFFFPLAAKTHSPPFNILVCVAFCLLLPFSAACTSQILTSVVSHYSSRVM